MAFFIRTRLRNELIKPRKLNRSGGPEGSEDWPEALLPGSRLPDIIVDTVPIHAILTQSKCHELCLPRETPFEHS